MATETVTHEHDEDLLKPDWSGATPPFKASYGKLMMWYFLLSDAFTFAAFLITYGALRFSMITWPVPDFVFMTHPFSFLGEGLKELPLIFVTVMSFLLIVSSVTMVRAVQEGHRENKSGVAFWMFLTILGGLGFLGCQAWEWTNLIKTEGMTITVNPFSNHSEAGTYLSGDQLLAANFTVVELGSEHDSHGADAHGDDSHGHHGTTTYYLAPGATEDLPENRFWVKENHDGDVLAGESFEDDSPYLITKHSENPNYQAGAYQTADGSTITKEQFGPKAFGGLFFFITGFHGFHVFSGVIFLLIIMINVMSGIYVKRKNGYEMVEKIGLYWHFVDLVWVFVFLVFYLL